MEETQDKLNVFTIRMTFEDINPIIKREVIIPANLYIGDLHKLIQLMGCWKNYHLHCFICNGYRYIPPENWSNDSLQLKEVAYSDMPVSKFFHEVGDEVEYLYDYGDGWRIKLELIESTEITASTKKERPVCISGENEYPCEDCGGVPGFELLKSILSDPQNPEYYNYRGWAGKYDPEHFNIKTINNRILRVGWKCIKD